MRSADKLTRLYPAIVGVNSLEVSKAVVPGDWPLVAVWCLPILAQERRLWRNLLAYRDLLQTQRLS